MTGCREWWWQPVRAACRPDRRRWRELIRGRAAKAATTSIPIVFVICRSGQGRSRRQPPAAPRVNATGINMFGDAGSQAARIAARTGAESLHYRRPAPTWKYPAAKTQTQEVQEGDGPALAATGAAQCQHRSRSGCGIRRICRARRWARCSGLQRSVFRVVTARSWHLLRQP